MDNERKYLTVEECGKITSEQVLAEFNRCDEDIKKLNEEIALYSARQKRKLEKCNADFIENSAKQQKEVDQCNNNFIELIEKDWKDLNQCDKNIRWLKAYKLIGEGDSKEARSSDAKKKYRQAILLLHPDKNNQANPLISQQLIEAYNEIYIDDKMGCYNKLYNESTTESTNNVVNEGTVAVKSPKHYVFWISIIVCILICISSFTSFIYFDDKLKHINKLFSNRDEIKNIARYVFFRNMSLVIFIVNVFISLILVLAFYLRLL